MKILFLLSSTSVFGGSTKAFLTLCSELVKDRSIDILVVCPNRGAGYEAISQMGGVKVLAVPMRTHIYPEYNSINNLLLFPLRMLYHYVINRKAFQQICTISKHYKPDVVYTNVSVISVGQKVAKKIEVPHIYHIREYQNLDFGMRIIPSLSKFKKNLQNQYSICITEGIQSHFGLNNHNSVVIYDGVRSEDAAFFDKEKRKYFLFVGRLDEAKGVKLVLEAFAKSRIRTHTLKIAGASLSRNEDSQLKALVKEYGIEDRVEFLGVVSDVDRIMRKATALVMASRFEGFGLVTAEAMFNGCLVIGRNVAGTKEQFDNGVKWTGDEIGIRWNSVDELSKCMNNVVENGIESYYSYIERAIKACKHYSIEQNALKIKEYIKFVIGNQ